MVGSNWSRVKHVKSGEGFLFHLHFLCSFGIPQSSQPDLPNSIQLHSWKRLPLSQAKLFPWFLGGFCQRKSWRFANENNGFYHHFAMVLPAKAGVFAVSQMNNFPEVWTSLFNATVVFTSIQQRNMNMTGWKNRQTFIVSQQDICVQQDWEVLGASVTWLALARQPTPSNPQKAIHIETWPPCCQHVWDVKAECQVDLTHSHPCWMVDLNCLVLKSIETWDTFSVAKKNPHDFPIDCEFPMIFMDFPCLMVSFVANSRILRC